MTISVFDGSENVTLLPVKDNQFGDAAYFEVKDSSEDYRKIYILKDNDFSNELLTVKTVWGNNVEDHYRDWDDGRSSVKVKGVESWTNGGYIIAFEWRDYNSWTGETSSRWEVSQVNDNGVVNWDTSDWDNLAKYELIFNEDLDENGAIGPKYTDLNSDKIGDGVSIDENENVYIKDIVSQNYIKIVDESGNSLNWLYEKDGSTKIQAAESLDDGGYIIAIKRENTDWWSGQTNVDWETVQVNDSGVINWSTSEWNNLAKREELFNQDLDNNGAIGPKYTQLASDKVGDSLFVDEDNNIFILKDNNSSNNYLEIVDEWGNSQSGWYNEWDGGSTKVQAIEAIEEGGYILAIKHENTDWWSGQTNVDWETVQVNDSGVINWSTSEWNNLAKREELFNQDVDINGSIGPKRIKINSDTYGDAIYVDEENYVSILIDDHLNNGFIEIKNEWGDPEGWLFDEWDGGSTKIQAAESLDDGGYIIAIKRENKDFWSGQTNVDWETVQLNYEGKINWSTSTWNELATYENLFKQDVDINGSIGPNYKSAKSNQFGDVAYYDENNKVYILKDNNPNNEYLSIRDEWGWAVTWLWEEWDDGGYKKIQAVEELEDGGYIIAIKQENVDSWNGTRWTDWETVQLNSQGVINWNTSEWNNLSKRESLFNEDVNEDGVIGVRYTKIENDTYGDALYRDDDNNVYILKDDDNSQFEYLLIKDEWGYGLSWWNDWGDGSYKAQAVESQSNGSFIIALKDTWTDTWTGVEYENWSTQYLNSDGIVNWNSGQHFGDDISDKESIFVQDLNGDNSIGINYNALEKISNDNDGDYLYKNSNNELYILTSENDWISVVDDWGNKLSMEVTNTWEDGSHSRLPLFVERSDNNTPQVLTDDYYQLAVKSEDTWLWNGANESNVWWDIHEISLDGRFDWDGDWGVSITEYEETFNSDMNYDGVKGFNIDALQSINTDTSGITIKKDKNENSLYIINGDETTLVRDQWGGNPSLDYDSFWEFGLNKREAWAITEKDDGGYLLATKFTDEYFDFDHRWVYDSNESIFSQDPNYNSLLELTSTNRLLSENDLPREGDTIKLTIQAFDESAEGSTVYISISGENWTPDDATFLETENVRFTNQNGSVKSGVIENGEFEFSVKLTQDEIDEGKEFVDFKVYTSPQLRESDLVWETVGEVNDEPNSTYSSWEIFSLSSSGILDWDSTTWTESITHYEEEFGQDLDGDGAIGFDENTLSELATDNVGERLLLDSNNNIFIKDSGNLIQVVEDWGGPVSFSWSDIWRDGSHTVSPYAVAKTFDSSSTINQSANSQSVTYYNTATNETRTLEEMLEAGWIELSEVDFGNAYQYPAIYSAGIISDENGPIRQALDMSEGDKVGDWIAVPSSDNSSSSNITPSSNGYYKLAVKTEDVWVWDGTKESDSSWEVYQIGLDGIVDWSKTEYSNSITNWEPIFGQDLNGDGDSTGNLNLQIRATDTNGVLLGEDSEGALYIVDNENNKQLSINDDWIEDSWAWEDGSYESVAISVALNSGNTSDTSNDYYQIAVKQTNTWRDYFTNQLVTDENWQIYAIDQSGYIDWDKSIFTESISNYENIFNDDLDLSGSTGDLYGLSEISSDQTGWILKKDQYNSLFINGIENGSEITFAITDNFGGIPIFDFNDDWGSGNHTSESIAVEKNPDGSFSLAIKHTNTNRRQTFIDWEILNISSKGVIDFNDFSSTIWTDDISAYESSIFNQDLDGDGFAGIGTENLASTLTDEVGDQLWKDKENNFYIYTDSREYLQIREYGGESAELKYEYSWGNGSFLSKAIAVESHSYTDSRGATVSDGFILAVKNETTYGEEKYLDWGIYYLDSQAYIDQGKTIFIDSINDYESSFDLDLNGDGAKGIVSANLTTLATDTSGDLLKNDNSGAYFIVDSETNEIISLVDEFGDSPSFDYSNSGGTGNYSWEHTSKTYAVESSGEGDSKKYILAIKSIYTFASLENTAWETFDIVKNNDSWGLDWSTATFSASAGTIETILQQDLDGDSSINASGILSKISTDISSIGVLGASLKNDTNGAIYLGINSGDYLIVDEEGSSANFDWQYNWAGQSHKSEAFAIEGVDIDNDGILDHYKLAIRHTITDISESESEGDSYVPTEDWETLQISLDENNQTAIIDFSTATYGDGRRHESPLNQDLDGDGNIWTESAETFTQVSTDTKGTLVYLDSQNQAFLEPEGSANKLQVIDSAGNAISFTQNLSLGSQRSYQTKLIASELIDISGVNYYQLLTQISETIDGDTFNFYETVNVNSSSMIIDWSTITWHEDPKKLENIYSLDLDNDGSITTISSTSSFDVSTDTNGARLKKTSDGSLFIQDGDNTFSITGPDNGFISFDLENSWSTGSFKSEALAVQKVGDEYKLAIRESSIYGDTLDVSYQVFTLSSSGKLDWNNSLFRTASEINEREFNQDITGDGIISKGSSSSETDTYTKLIKTTNIDPSVTQLYANTAQSDFVSIKNSQANSDDDIEMFVKGVDGLAKSSYEIDVKIVQEANPAVIEKITRDSGLVGSDTIPLTGLMDFSVNIEDEKNFGKIVNVSWVLPEGTTDPNYLKRDPSGRYFDFEYNQSIGEGAKWDQDANVLTVFVKDNGRYDSDPTLGVVRDPAYITASGTDSTNFQGSTISSSTQIKVADVNSSFIADDKGFASVSGLSPVTITAYTVGEKATLDLIKDYDGSLHAGDNLEETPTSYKYQGMLDVNGDGTFDAIFTNDVSRRWVTAKVDSTTGQIDFDDNGAGGGTRVVGIYDDPLIAVGESNNGYLEDGVTPAPANFGISEESRYVEYNGETVDRLALNSQVRFQNDLDIDNLQAKHSGDYDGDGVHEVYWKTSDGTAYLRSLMHADGNIRYANYQSEAQMKEYLTTNGDDSIITDITS